MPWQIMGLPFFLETETKPLIITTKGMILVPYLPYIFYS